MVGKWEKGVRAREKRARAKVHAVIERERNGGERGGRMRRESKKWRSERHESVRRWSKRRWSKKPASVRREARVVGAGVREKWNREKGRRARERRTRALSFFCAFSYFSLPLSTCLVAPHLDSFPLCTNIVFFYEFFCCTFCYPVEICLHFFSSLLGTCPPFLLRLWVLSSTSFYPWARKRNFERSEKFLRSPEIFWAASKIGVRRILICCQKKKARKFGQPERRIDWMLGEAIRRLEKFLGGQETFWAAKKNDWAASKIDLVATRKY